MAINVSQAFHRTSANPVDESMTLTKAQMKTVNDNLMPAYYFTICQDDGYIYLYDKSATASASTGKFKKFEGGSSGGGGTSEPTIINKTLTAAGWSNKQQTVNFNGYDVDLGGVMGVPTSATAAQEEAYSEAIINVVSQSGTSFTFSCENVPEIDLPVTLYAGGGGTGGGSAEYPAGGTTGQALVKKSDADNDVEWKTIDGEKTQYDTMPPATEDNLDQIVQYTGETTTIAPIYKNSKFYKCVLDGSTYKWEQTNVDVYPEADLSKVFASGFPTASVIGDTKIYAPFEHQIGWWYEEINGTMKKKPVYEKNITFIIPSNQNAYDLSTLSVDKLISCEGWFQFGVYRLSIGQWYNSSNYTTACQSTDGGNNLLWMNVAGYQGANAVATLQYTKTTDEWETV